MKFYRYEHTEDHRSLFPTFPKVRLKCVEYVLVKETPKGYWIEKNIPKTNFWYLSPIKKWIPKQSRKRFAYPTKEEALHSKLVRTKKWKFFVEKQLNKTKGILQEIEKLQKEKL